MVGGTDNGWGSGGGGGLKNITGLSAAASSASGAREPWSQRESNAPFSGASTWERWVVFGTKDHQTRTPLSVAAPAIRVLRGCGD